MIELSNRDWAHFYFEDYDLEAQLLAIKSAIALARRAEVEQNAEIDRLAERAKKIGSDHLVGSWTDGLQSSVYHDAARSASAVGMLAPFIENLFTGIFRGIGKLGDDVLGHRADSDRAKRAVAIFWDPHLLFAKEGVENDLVSGIKQLCDASELTQHMPGDMVPLLQALFAYRNRMMHSGFEWPLEARTRFENQRRGWPARWFASAKQGNQPWVWYMTDTLIDRILAFIDQVLEGAGQHVRLHYVPARDRDRTA